MSKRCVICKKKVQEDYGKLKGTIVRVKNEKKKTQFLYVCSDCQNNENWIEVAKVKGV